ncbi:reverse transcriptase domain-containing protein [Mesorhizobium sp. M0227]|uniref:reverse transcriptase domain-containing protein n=1 Tax=unclassified Mesorhizobium TaxID=325217 RepID=UPI00333BA6F4
MSAHIVRAINKRVTWRDWKGDLVPTSYFGIPVVRATIPPELANEASLLTYLGMSAKELKKIWWFRGRMYHQFEIAKGKDKTRIISAPNERLKYLQRQIAPLLDRLYRVRNPVHGFVSGKSVKTNALAHLRKRYVLNIDLKDFFPSITESRVTGVLEALGIDSRVASIITRLCCSNSHLPQGAPTSPVLSNMICFRLDKELLAFAKGVRCIYTRYADDITLSSHQPMAALFEGPAQPLGHFAPDLLVSALRNIVVSNGFAINPEKAHYADRNSRRMVTGLKINELINVDRRYVRNIRAALYSVETLGRTAAQAKFKRDHGGSSDLGKHLGGKITWLKYIRGQSDPVFRAIAIRFNASFPDRKIEVTPTADEIRDRAVWVIEYCEGEGEKLKLLQGSAFFLKDVGLVTAAHCVEGVDEIEVYHPSKFANRFTATVLKRDKHRDLAILGHAIPTTEYFDFERSTHAVAVGQELIAVGYPSFGPGDRLNVRDGKVSSLPVKHGVKLIEVTQKLSQGMSGGPILDSNDAVAGVVHKGGPGEGRDFAIHVEVLNDWLAE